MGGDGLGDGPFGIGEGEGMVPLPPRVNRLTDTCGNIIFLQLHLRIVINVIWSHKKGNRKHCIPLTMEKLFRKNLLIVSDTRCN